MEERTKGLNICWKSIIQIGLIISGINFITFAFPVEAQRLFGSLELLETFNSLAAFIKYGVVLFLIYWIWKYDTLEKRTKYIWTFYILAFTVLAGTFYIWKKIK